LWGNRWVFSYYELIKIKSVHSFYLSMTLAPRMTLNNGISNVGEIRRHPDFGSRYVGARTVEVWLPRAYAAEPNRRFPVLYMQDGQNLFDPAVSFGGVTWGVAEVVSGIIENGEIRPVIVVGIWNTRHRGTEYLPKTAVHTEIGQAGTAFANNPVADDYLRFMAEEVKPFVDATYRTSPAREDTFALGSSRGALISLYAVTARPSVFAGAGCVSTHWPAAHGVLVAYFSGALPRPGAHRFYFDHGTETLDAKYPPYQARMDDAMRRLGYTEGKDWITRVFPGAEHSERAWRERLHVPLAFLLGAAR
jgi:predicted alpha/beta superfamily hydrolase